MDPLAADVVGAKLLGFQVQAVRHLWEAVAPLSVVRPCRRCACGRRPCWMPKSCSMRPMTYRLWARMSWRPSSYKARATRVGGRACC
jgi:hypothetical protein